MIQCQNCGQVNNYSSNFCRFCGTRMVLTKTQNQDASYEEYKPPRPYVWKTDEFQVSETEAKKTQQINQVQPLFRQSAQNQNIQPPNYQPSSLMNYGYRCPSCGTQNLPRIERKISTTGWIVFAGLMIVFFPLFWIGLLMKEDIKVCPICNARVG